MKHLTLMLTILLFSSVNSALAQTEDLQNPNTIHDSGEYISAKTRARVAHELEMFAKKNNAKLHIYIANSLNDNDANRFSSELQKSWNEIYPETTSRVIILIAPNEHQASIVTSPNLNNLLTEELKQNIVDVMMLHQIDNRDLNWGVIQGLKSVLQALEGTYQIRGSKLQEDKEDSQLWLLLIVIPIALVLRHLGKKLPRQD